MGMREVAAGGGTVRRKGTHPDRLEAQIEQWGEDILAQIPEAEIDQAIFEGLAARRRGHLGPWGKYESWLVFLRLKDDVALELADSLDPWLRAEGWEFRHADQDEFYADRSYLRDECLLVMSLTVGCNDIDIWIFNPLRGGR